MIAALSANCTDSGVDVVVDSLVDGIHRSPKVLNRFGSPRSTLN